MMALPPHPWPSFGARPLLGANGTEAMIVLLQAGERELVDYLKVGPFMGQEAIAALAPHYPLLLHLDDALGTRQAPTEEMIQSIEVLVRLTGTPWVSEHIAYGAADAHLRNALHSEAVSDLWSYDEALEHIVRNARLLAARLSVPLLLENIPCFPNAAHRHVCKPAFIAAVIAETDCDLLLDLAHVRVSADILGYDVYDYVRTLPLERVIELHLSGPRPVAEARPRLQALARENARHLGASSFGEHSLVDAHEPLCEEDYALLEWTLQHSSPQAISLEYFREAAALREQLERLGRIIGR